MREDARLCMMAPAGCGAALSCPACTHCSDSRDRYAGAPPSKAAPLPSAALPGSTRAARGSLRSAAAAMALAELPVGEAHLQAGVAAAVAAVATAGGEAERWAGRACGTHMRGGGIRTVWRRAATATNPELTTRELRARASRRSAQKQKDDGMIASSPLCMMQAHEAPSGSGRQRRQRAWAARSNYKPSTESTRHHQQWMHGIAAASSASGRWLPWGSPAGCIAPSSRDGKLPHFSSSPLCCVQPSWCHIASLSQSARTGTEEQSRARGGAVAIRRRKRLFYRTVHGDRATPHSPGRTCHAVRDRNQCQTCPNITANLCKTCVSFHRA